MIQTVLTWLRGYPGLEGLQPEHLGPCPGDAGLFFRGLTLESSRQDLLGRKFHRKSLEFYLERHCAGDSGTLWLREFSRWAEANPPVLGDESILHCRQGQVVARDETGIQRCRLQLYFEFTETLEA